MFLASVGLSLFYFYIFLYLIFGLACDNGISFLCLEEYVVVVVFTLKAVPVSTQYILTSVLVQLTRTPSVVTG